MLVELDQKCPRPLCRHRGHGLPRVARHVVEVAQVAGRVRAAADHGGAADRAGHSRRDAAREVGQPGVAAGEGGVHGGGHGRGGARASHQEKPLIPWKRKVDL